MRPPWPSTASLLKVSPSPWLTRWLRIDSLPDTMQASMLHDLKAGRPLELPWLSGAVARLGKLHGIATPVSYPTDPSDGRPRTNRGPATYSPSASTLVHVLSTGRPEVVRTSPTGTGSAV